MMPWTRLVLRCCLDIYWIFPASAVSIQPSSFRSGPEFLSASISRKRFSTVSAAGRWSFPPSALKNLKGGFSHRQEKITERTDYSAGCNPRYPVCRWLPGTVHRQLRPLETRRRLSGGWNFPCSGLSCPVRLPPCGTSPSLWGLWSVYLYRAFGGAAPYGHADWIQRHR